LITEAVLPQMGLEVFEGERENGPPRRRAAPIARRALAARIQAPADEAPAAPPTGPPTGGRLEPPSLARRIAWRT
jgi:hypothetical protein